MTAEIRALSRVCEPLPATRGGDTAGSTESNDPQVTRVVDESR